MEESTVRMVGRNLADAIRAGEVEALDTEAAAQYVASWLGVVNPSDKARDLDPFSLLMGSAITFAFVELEAREGERP